MGTQFLLSLVGGGVAGGGLLLIAGRYAYKWYKKEKIDINGEMVAIISILLMTGVISAYKLAESSYQLAQDGVKSALHTGQEVIEKTLKWGTVTLLEGIGQPYHDYQKKWKEDSIKPIEKMEIKLISSKEKIVNNQKEIHLIIEVTNSGTTPLNLNNLLSQELIIVTDNKNNTYSLQKLNYEKSIIESGESSLREMDIIVPKEVELYQIATPIKQLLLKR